jgi:glycerophosphoryl diester phosphodiesterase
MQHQLAATMAMLSIMTIATSVPAQAVDERPLVIAHRGASGYRPEHTLGAYSLGVEMGADCVEPDLVMTRDGELIARHEPEIGATTDVAEKFPDRKTTKQLDGKSLEGWFAEDFTLAEIKTLRAKQSRAFRASAWDGIFEVPTLQEVINLAKAATVKAGREICIYPETKHPTYFAEQGLDIDAALVTVLDRNGLTEPTSPVFIQSFETGNLKKLKGMTKVRLVQLMDDFDAQPYDSAKAGARTTYRDLMQPAALAEIATYAYGIGPWKRTILPETDGALGAVGSLVADAHAAGLKVHPYTFRDEPQFLAKDYGTDAAAEYLQFFRLGVDGVFSDFPDTAVRARDRFTGS